jgi:hypothetical protein
MQTQPSSSPWIVRLSVRIYRGLLRGTGPTDYFHEYGHLTVQLFRECCLETYQERGTLGVLSLWLPSFRDAIAQMVLEFLCQRQYTSQPLVSVGTVVSTLTLEWFSAPTDFVRRLMWPLIRHLWLPLTRELSRPLIHASRLSSPTNMHFERQLLHWRGPHGWRSFRGRKPYESSVDPRTFQGMPSIFLRSKAKAASDIGAVTKFHHIDVMLTQAIKAEAYRGKHIHFAGDVKVDHVEPQAGLLIDITLNPPKTLSQRWHQKRPQRVGQEKPTQGTHDWMHYDITIPVPLNAQYIDFGLILHGTGQIWLANPQLEVIEQDVVQPA